MAYCRKVKPEKNPGFDGIQTVPPILHVVGGLYQLSWKATAVSKATHLNNIKPAKGWLVFAMELVSKPPCIQGSYLTCLTKMTELKIYHPSKSTTSLSIIIQ